ncbi:DNA-binding transcriptional regulator, MocR family / aminotransferase domain, partial [hydrothermal vent metagenome]
RQSLQADESTLKPGCGWLPPDWMPHENIRRALRSLSRAEPTALTDYGTPKGFVPLREHLLWRMGEHRIEASLDQVMLTSSGTHALELLCRFFLEPGDIVLVDDPCYFNFHALLKAHRVKVVSVPMTPNGPDMERFEQVLLEHQPRLYITNSAIHNPTGAIVTPATAHKILNLAEKSDLVIIEDDIFGDMEVSPAPRLAALDGLNRVIHIGSFSKTLSAAIRCGFIATKTRWIEPLTDLKIATSFGGEPFGAQVTWRVLKDGSYRKHLSELRQRLSKAMGKTNSRLSKIGITPWINTKAGMYLWSQLPAGFDAIEVARKARAQGIILAPGNVFSLNNSASRFLRFNVAQSSSPKIYEVLQSIILEQG